MRTAFQAALAAALVIACGPAMAQQPSEPAQTTAPADGPVRDGPGRQALAACRGDMQTLCGGIERGGGRKIACLKENQAKLSPGCQAAISTVLARFGAGRATTAAALPPLAASGGAPTANGDVRQACHADIATVCAGVEKGGGRIGKCLKDNAGKLSPGCQAAIADRKNKMQVLKKAAKAACAADSHTLCGTGVNGHAERQCLHQKEAQLSNGCRQALAALPKPRHE